MPSCFPCKIVAAILMFGLTVISQAQETGSRWVSGKQTALLT
jgi:hypothetical protein